MNRVVRILMERDDMTRKEAEKLVEDVRDDINSVLEDGDAEAVEDIVYSNLGLEMDYIYDILEM